MNSRHISPTITINAETIIIKHRMRLINVFRPDLWHQKTRVLELSRGVVCLI